PLAGGNFKAANANLVALVSDIVSAAYKQEIESIASHIREAGAAFEKEDYGQIPSILENLRNSDNRGWMAPLESTLFRLSKIAEERNAMQLSFRSSVEKGNKLYDQLRWEEAISVWKTALDLFPKDASVLNRISEVEGRLNEEKRVAAQVKPDLKK